MGQEQSIATFDYENVNKVIKIAPTYKNDSWKSTASANKTTYWKTNNKNLTATINKNEWPLAAQKLQLTPGHHFFNIDYNGAKYYYDAEQEQWVETMPPEPVKKFFEQWQKLIKEANENQKIIDQQKTTTQTTVKTTQQTAGQQQRQINLNDEDLTQIAMLIQQHLKPIEDKLNKILAGN